MDYVYSRHRTTVCIVSTDLCKTCQDMNVYMIAFECFQDRWNFPKAYHLFYETFFKAAVGEKNWKGRLEQGEPFGNSNTEAFALMVLKNNYIAWMAQAATEFNFENQYSMELKRRRRLEGNDEDSDEDEEQMDLETEEEATSILEEAFPEMQYYQVVNEQGTDSPKKNSSNKSTGNNNSDDDISHTTEDEEMDGQALRLEYSSWTIVTPDSDPGLYMKAIRYNQVNLAMARHKIADSDLQEYASAVESLQCLSTNVQSQKTVMSSNKQRRNSSRAALLRGLGNQKDHSMIEATQETTSKTSPQEKKRRKILKGLKRFTKKGDTRNEKQKGWSTEGYRYHAELTQQILNQEQLDRPFVDLFRRLALNVIKLAEIDNGNKKKKYSPDRQTVWQL